MNLPLRILGTGVYQPRRLVPSEELDVWLGKPAGWTQRHSELASRRWVTDETAAEMGAAALGAALHQGGLGFGDLDCLLAASGTTDQAIPCNAAMMHAEPAFRGLRLASFDVNATCLSFAIALNVAAGLLATGQYRRIGVVAAEIASVGLHPGAPETAAILADGAAAAVLGLPPPGESGRLLAARFETHSEGAGLCGIPGGGSRRHPARHPETAGTDGFFHMDGPALHRLAAGALPPLVESVLAAAGLDRHELAVVVPHQASRPALARARRRLGFSPEQWVELGDGVGNQIAASLPHALHRAIVDGRLRRGQQALLVGTSAGVSLGALALEY